MIRSPYLLLAVSIAYAAVSASEAVNPSETIEFKHDLPALKMLDKDSDGLISRDEGLSNQYVVRYWDKLDTNLDGYLAQPEFDQLASTVQREESLKTAHPQVVQQFKHGKYISPAQQIERNKQ
jgi:hypothetical protein